MACKPLPFFLQKRMKDHYQDRLSQQWRGVHLLRSRAPSTGDVSLCSNDYLSLCQEPGLRIDANKLFATNILMSSVFLDDDSLQSAVERAFAEFFRVQNSILCPSGWMANAGLIQSIADQNVPVYLDMLAHMSFHDGARLANAQVHLFAHNDAAHARKQIHLHGAGIIVVDAVYSTNGSRCPLADFALLAEEHDCILVVDESHSAGTHGAEGRGLVNALNLQGRVDFLTVSLAKAFAGRAGLITCSTDFKDYFSLESHPTIFSTALMQHDLQWFAQVLPFVAHAEDKRRRLHDIAHRLRDELARLGYRVGSGTEQIIAVEIGSESDVQLMQNSLLRQGIFGSVFCYPATARNRALIRLSVHAALTDAELSRTVQAFSRTAQETGCLRPA
ncbi:alpha-hydroxyketone-type quorum-sensing autoinducer synthase [Pseudomonas sp. NPDC090202]|uniref:alpha-hydroxyketone-type quorum-sensing autoinducer synthase n=1 Tax=unclassified Pseudomonas TaxID=196821 RepID=UPI00381627C1